MWRAVGSMSRGAGGVDLVSTADAPATGGRVGMGTGASRSSVALPTRQGETSFWSDLWGRLRDVNEICRLRTTISAGEGSAKECRLLPGATRWLSSAGRGRRVGRRVSAEAPPGGEAPVESRDDRWSNHPIGSWAPGSWCGLGRLTRRGLAAAFRVLGPEAGDVEFQQDRVMHQAIDRRGGRHLIAEDAIPVRED
jgi:hypothetical protein